MPLTIYASCSGCTRWLPSLWGRGAPSKTAFTRRAARFLTDISSSENGRAIKSLKKPFRVIGSPLTAANKCFKNSAEASRAAELKYADILRVSKKGGGDKAVERHVKVSKKLLTIDRLNKLIDDESDFLEIGAIAGMGMPYGDVPSGGLTAGIGQVCGRLCMVLINDGTVKGGTVYPITVKKQLRAQEVAMTLGLSCIYFVDSGGAFLPLQAAIFPDKEHGGRVFYNEAVMSARNIAQVAIVCGNCTAGGAYVPTMAEEAVIVDKIGTIFLGGPPLVKAALGEVVSAEELGGATLHCKTSGCTDYFALSEDQAIDVCRDIVTTLNLPECSAPTCGFEEPLYSSTELSCLLPNLEADVDVMHQIIARLVDGSRFHEFKALFGPSLISGFAHVKGHLVGVLANNGWLTAEAADKGAHFVELCTKRNIPMAFLLNVSGSGQASTDVLRSHSRMIAAVACSAVPKFTFLIGDCFGYSAQVMCSRALGATLVFAWPSSRTALMEPTVMAEKAAAEESDPQRKQVLHEMLCQQFSKEASALHGASHLWSDGIVLPQDTRDVLGKCLKIAAGSKSSPAPTSSRLQPIYRM